MDHNISKMLEAEQQPDNIQRLLRHLNRMLKGSRRDMAKSYPIWDRNISVYRGIVWRNDDDREARDDDEPERFVTPLSFAQVQTFVAFAFLLLMQNKPFYQYTPSGDEDFSLEEAIMKLVQRDLNHNEWPTKLYQFLLDMARCSIGIFNSYWKTETMWVQLPQPGQVNEGMFRTITAPTTINTEVTKYEGNAIQCVSPYRFLPDTRKPLSRWKEGQFAADEDEWHIQELKELARQEMLVGIDHIDPYENIRDLESFGPRRMWKIKSSIEKKSDDPKDFMAIVTQMQVRLVPKDFSLGDESYSCLYLVRIANDKRIISLEKASYLHGEFTYDLSQLSPDQHARLNESLSDVVHALQDVVSWLINSRIMAVRKSLDSHFIFDPAMFEVADIEARSPFIKLKKNASRVGIDKFFKQLEVRDVTQSHMQDADTLMKVMQFVTGVNDNAMGQYNTGRRSATEARAANSGAAARMKVPVTIAWHSAFSPLGRKIVTNQRQGMSIDTFKKILGEGPNIETLYVQYCPDNPAVLVGNEDFFVFDATLESEKGFIAQSLQELLIAVINNPEMAQVFDVEALIKEIQLLRGVTNVTRFIRPQITTPYPVGPVLGANGRPVVAGPPGVAPVPPVTGTSVVPPVAPGGNRNGRAVAGRSSAIAR